MSVKWIYRISIKKVNEVYYGLLGLILLQDAHLLRNNYIQYPYFWYNDEPVSLIQQD